MDFPEPLSSMLREFDINTYLASQQPISFDKVDKEKPYIVCKPISIITRIKMTKAGYKNPTPASQFSLEPKVIGFLEKI